MILRSIAILLLLVVSSCGAEKEKRTSSPRIRNVSTIVEPKSTHKYTILEPIPVKVDSRLDSIEIRSVLVKQGPDTLAFSEDSHLTIEAFGQVGQKTLTLRILLSNGKVESYNSRMTVYAAEPPSEYGYRIINTFPHDPEAFIQGLLVHNGKFYESTGQQGQSDLRISAIETGRVEKKINLSDEYFGEGLALHHDQLFQLTWESNICFVYDPTTLNLIKTFNYEGEGWGMTTIGDELIMSDKTEVLSFRDPESFEELRTLQVFDDQGPVANVNEMEYVDGLIYANVWQTDDIIMIDPQSGEVKGKLNLEGILDTRNYNRKLDVLNGIAFNEKSGTFYVTGKWWPKLFEIELIKKETI